MGETNVCYHKSLLRLLLTWTKVFQSFCSTEVSEGLKIRQLVPSVDLQDCGIIVWFGGSAVAFLDQGHIQTKSTCWFYLTDDTWTAKPAGPGDVMHPGISYQMTPVRDLYVRYFWRYILKIFLTWEAQK